jgi:hypothetical protein
MRLNPKGHPRFESIASTGMGVSETLRAAIELIDARR